MDTRGDDFSGDSHEWVRLPVADSCQSYRYFPIMEPFIRCEAGPAIRALNQEPRLSRREWENVAEQMSLIDCLLLGAHR
jgi:hypothetical protein